MLWFTIWLVLVLGAVALLAWIGYVLFRKGMTLMLALSEAAELLGRAAEQVERLQRAEPEDRTPAVFADPHELRRGRERAQRRRSGARRMRTSRAGG